MPFYLTLKFKRLLITFCNTLAVEENQDSLTAVLRKYWRAKRNVILLKKKTQMYVL